jgi:hypothetical protein
MLVIRPLECIPGAVFSDRYTRSDGKKEVAVDGGILSLPTAHPALEPGVISLAMHPLGQLSLWFYRPQLPPMPAVALVLYIYTCTRASIHVRGASRAMTPALLVSKSSERAVPGAVLLVSTHAGLPEMIGTAQVMAGQWTGLAVRS